VVLLIDELVRFAETLDDQWHSPLADAAADRWNLERPLFVRSSAAHVFVARASVDGPRVVLRLRPESADAVAVLERGARAARAWRRAGGPFVDAVSSRAGRLVERVDGYVATALIAAEGEPLEESAVDISSARRWGATVARLHRHGATGQFSDVPATEALATGENLGSRLAAVVSAVRSDLALLPRQLDVYGVLHGDPEPDNVVVTPEGMVLVDPDEVRLGWFASDVAFALRAWHDTTGRLDWTTRCQRHFSPATDQYGHSLRKS
jgi:Ser/Thr protein kinase RdoA (MazF antagonist)